MKMKANSRVWNLGDTSFRRKKLMDDYTILLKMLKKHNEIFNDWDKQSQKKFHSSIINDTELLKESDTDTENLDRRARTMTNALAKIGLCTRERELTNIGNLLLQLDDEYAFEEKSIEYPMDELEKLLGLSRKNILFLRQLLKFTIFSSCENHQFNPFLIALCLLSKYDYIEIKHFKDIIQNLYFEQDYSKVISEYRLVKEGKLDFDKYIRTYLFIEESDINRDFIENFINNGDNFKEVFKNRKTGEYVALYEDFYKALKKFRSEKKSDNISKKTAMRLLSIARDASVKKAFNTNNLFKIPNKSSNDYQGFIENNVNNELFILKDYEFRSKLYNIFALSKTNNLIQEYFDVTLRTFNLTGVIDFSSGRVKISKKYLKDTICELEEELLESLSSNKYKNIEDYRNTFYDPNISSMDILNLDKDKLDSTTKELVKSYGLKEIEELDNYYLTVEENEFIEFIDIKFPEKKLIEILENIKCRNDNDVFDSVTDNANIPTIFEYIMAISWYRISKNRKYKLLDSMNLTLDGSHLPLSHAAGGDGDIIIDYDDHKLMLEVTLMDLNNQRRNEMEPVIRHTVNLTVDSDKPVYTGFIANDIDYNTSELFRACSHINLKSSKGDKKTENGINIFSMKIDEIIKCLENNISYENIYEHIHNEFINDRQNVINTDWRKGLISKILSTPNTTC